MHVLIHQISIDDDAAGDADDASTACCSKGDDNDDGDEDDDGCDDDEDGIVESPSGNVIGGSPLLGLLWSCVPIRYLESRTCLWILMIYL